MTAVEWQLKRELWSQSDTGFALVSRDGRAAGSWAEGRLAALLGCRASSPACSKAEGCSRFFPSAFEFCPSCGGRLAAAPAASSELWLPPYGNELGRGQRPFGLRLTETPLTPEPTDPTLRPHSEMLAPVGASLQYLVSPLGERAPALLAIDCREGNLFVLTGTDTWTPLDPAGDAHLSGWSLPSDGWRAAVEDLSRSNRLWLPTDHGLCELHLDLPSLSYQAEYLTPPCIGAPLRFGQQILVPCAGKPSAIELVSVSIRRADAARTVLVVPLAQADGRHFASAVAASRRAFWEARDGQLIVSVLPTGELSADFVPWPSGTEPWFSLGSPDADRQGQLWRQCRSPDGRIQYVRLGREPEIYATDGPRFGTGGISFRQGIVISERERPWDEVMADADTAAKIVIPLIEHDSQDVAVCVEIDWTGGIDALLRSPGKVPGRYGLRGATNRNLLNFDIRRPWDATVFVWDRHLFIAHPDLERIAGWKLQ